MQPNKMAYTRTDSILIPLKTSQPKTCAYCNKLIENSDYTLKWFPVDAQFMPVHTEHLINRNTKQVMEGNS